jgi:U3 small nucleolar RNA-associated protein 19
VGSLRAGAGAKTKADDEPVRSDGHDTREVKSWVRDRLFEYIEVLAGLLRDSEAALRVSCYR